ACCRYPIPLSHEDRDASNGHSRSKSGSKLRALHTLREVRKPRPFHLTRHWKKELARSVTLEEYVRTESTHPSSFMMGFDFQKVKCLFLAKCRTSFLFTLPI